MFEGEGDKKKKVYPRLPDIWGKKDTPYSFYLLHPQTFSNNSLHLSEEKRIFAEEKLHSAICKQAYIVLAGIIRAALKLNH